MQHFHLTFSLRHRPSTEALLRKLAKSLDYVTGKFCFNTERRKCTYPQIFLHYPMLVNATHSLLPFKRRNTIWNGGHPPELRLGRASLPPFIWSSLADCAAELWYWSHACRDIMGVDLRPLLGPLFEKRVTENGCNLNESRRISSSFSTNTLETKVRYYLPFVTSWDAACKERMAS